MVYIRVYDIIIVNCSVAIYLSDGRSTCYTLGCMI